MSSTHSLCLLEGYFYACAMLLAQRTNSATESMATKTIENYFKPLAPGEQLRFTSNVRSATTTNETPHRSTILNLKKKVGRPRKQRSDTEPTTMLVDEQGTSASATRAFDEPISCDELAGENGCVLLHASK